MVIDKIQKSVRKQLKNRNIEVFTKAIEIFEAPECKWSYHRQKYLEALNALREKEKEIETDIDEDIKYSRAFIMPSPCIGLRNRIDNVNIENEKEFHHRAMGNLKSCRCCKRCFLLRVRKDVKNG